MSADKKMTIEEAADKGLLSADIAQEKRDALKQLFPEVFTEDTIDFEQLRRVMGDWVEPGKERYGLNWPGKAECMKVVQAPSIATLKPVREESVNFDETENLFIEGDNLEVLKLLQKAYFGKIKMIYIDPPYNTGKEFIYPDKYQENLDTYLAYTGQVDDEGKKFATNTDAGGRYHSNWLNMMYPRLYLARNLLRDDGVIFISIDDNEQANLKALCDLIFGAENFIAELIWERAYAPKNDAKYVSNSHDYVLMYSKRYDEFKIGRLPRSDVANSRYKNPDDDTRGVWKSSDLSVKTYNQEYDYPITTPSGRVVEPPAGRCWSLSKKAFLERLHDNRIWFGSDGNSTPSIKRFLSELKFDGMVPTSILFYKDVGHNQEGAKEVISLFDGSGYFDGPKPVRLLNRLLTLANISSSDIILDFFAGSATTADAVMQMNAEDGGNRQFICVQLPEPCGEESEALKAGFRTIADIGRGRIRRAAQKIATKRDGQLDLKNTDKLDLGFRAFRLDHSNFNLWDGEVEKAEDLAAQLELHVDHIDQESSAEDILYELLLKAGFKLTTKVEKKTMAGKDVYAVSDGAMLICLDKAITPELIDALADANPLQFICLDEGFNGNDQLKTNAAQTFKSRAREDEEPIVFRTV
ncbi:site-specific DNA-methyltransferase [Ruegeria sp.]|uniref:site-specific DNA-methyltransferase n=1 Tax=Ruegeria sp. TaxID=1879320 RepID=UPI003AFFBD39